MNLSRNRLRYCSFVLSMWIVLYFISSQKMDEEQSYPDKKSVTLNFTSDNILANEIDAFSKKTITEVLGDDAFKSSDTDISADSDANNRNAFQNLANQTAFREQTNQNALQNNHQRHWLLIPMLQKTPQRNTSESYENVPPVQREIRNERENKINPAVTTIFQRLNHTSKEKANLETTMPNVLNENDTDVISINTPSKSNRGKYTVNKAINSDPLSYYNFSKTVITPLNDRFLVANEHTCRDISPDLIILVPSSPRNTPQRLAIRRTYGTLSRDRKSNINGVNVKVLIRAVFLIGKSSNPKMNNALSDENSIYKDLVLIDFIDTYDQLTKKVLHGLKWANDFCPNVSYVMKVDDDVFVNTAILFQRLQRHPRTENGSVFGHVYNGYRAVARTGKWAVTYAEFPLPSFPNYMSGTSYVITMDLVPKILYTAQRLPYLSIEDAFVTGVIANGVLGASMIDWKDNSVWTYMAPDPCKFIKGHLSMTNITPKLMSDIWSILKSNGTKPNGTRCV